MNKIKRFSNLYAVIRDHTVIAYGTNHKAYYAELQKIEELKDEIPSLDTIKRRFNKGKKLVYIGSDGKVYTLQQVVTSGNK